MITPAAARAAMLAGCVRLPGEMVSLNAAYSRTLAQDVRARIAQPPFDASAMDGWAVRRADAPGLLHIIGESAAGNGFVGKVEAGQAVRIFTGAPVPAGADVVIVQEDSNREGSSVRVPAADGVNIRARGLDFDAGAVLLAAGAPLDGVSISLAAAAGVDPVAVTRLPRVLIVATGDELVRPGEALGSGQIFDSVSIGLAGLVRQWGGEPTRLKAVGDTLEALVVAIRPHADQSDLVVTIGGASVGDYDLVKPAAQALGGELLVENVALRPGKPTWFARAGALSFLGLPGNPASALVCAQLFLRPLLRKMLGRPEDDGFSRALLDAALPANGPREHYIRAHLGHDADGLARVTPFEQHDSSLLSVFQRANALVRLPARAPAQPRGSLVDVVALERF